MGKIKYKADKTATISKLVMKLSNTSDTSAPKAK
jgi:hypothetical protein